LHNVRNALAAIAVAHACAVPASTIAEGLLAFRGVKRRLEVFGEADGVTIYDDFAHHPTAIAETLEGVRSAHPDKKIWAIFEPRSATSCRKIFQSDFARALGRADRVILPAVFRSSLPDDQRLSAEALVQDLTEAGVDADYIRRMEAEGLRVEPDDLIRERSGRRARRRPPPEIPAPPTPPTPPAPPAPLS